MQFLDGAKFEHECGNICSDICCHSLRLIVTSNGSVHRVSVPTLLLVRIVFSTKNSFELKMHGNATSVPSAKKFT